VKLLKHLFWSITFFLGLSLSVNALTYFNFNPEYSFLRIKRDAVASGFYLPFYYAHVLVGGLILTAGFFQVWTWFRNRFAKAHRLLGYFYVYGILLFAGPGGFAMSFFVDRGPFVLVSFLIQCTLWFYFTTKAVISIRKKDIEAHELWMWRSFALTLAAITLRVYIFISSFYFDLNNITAYSIIAWASWVPNLVAVEYLKKGTLLNYKLI
jgi:hypothetical protein